MRAALLALRYFAMVFGAGFALALVRIPFLVPRLGVRMAELAEMPLMLLVIGLASRRVWRRAGAGAGAGLLAVGAMALLLMLVAELALAWFVSGQSPLGYVASRDPVSGTAYALGLLVFALAPWLWSRLRAA